MNDDPLSRFEETLHYRFVDRSLLENALRHRSFVNEQATDLSDNERLEFLGDAVLNLIVSHDLMERFPKLKEGDLSRTRSALVNEKRLAAVAKSIDLGNFLQLGKGEHQTRGRHKKSILADAFEAIIAAVYLDGGLNAAFAIIRRHFESHFETFADAQPLFDYKSLLQELVQNRKRTVPEYRVIAEIGPDHDKTFRVSLFANGLCTEGTGKTKKAAEQAAAKAAYEILTENDSENA